MYNDFGSKKYGQLPLTLGSSRRRIFAGPYRDKPAGMFGIKLAEEVNRPCDVDLPIQDFDVPRDPARLRTALAVALDRMARGLPTYVGCYGGRGRTGLFLTILAKATGIDGQPVPDFTKPSFARPMVHPAVAYVRANYNPHAVETDEQQEFIRDLNLSPLRFTMWKAKATAGLVDFAIRMGLNPDKLAGIPTLTNEANLP